MAPLRPRAAALALLLALGLSGVAARAAGAEEAPADPEGQRAAARLALDLDRQLLSGDAEAYREARARAVGARLRADEIAVRLDEQLAATPIGAGAEKAAQEAVAAREELGAAEAREDRALAALEERLRRIDLLDRRLAGPETARADRADDSVAGRWRLLIDPGTLLGILDLTVAGDVVTGSLQPLAATPPVAVRGSLANGTIRFEPIAAEGASPRSFTGEIEPKTGRLLGSWQDHDAETGQPTSAGTWSAERLRGDDIEQEDIPQ